MVLDGSLRAFAGLNGNCLHICGWHLDNSRRTIICGESTQLRRVQIILGNYGLLPITIKCPSPPPHPATSYLPLNLIRIIGFGGLAFAKKKNEVRRWRRGTHRYRD
jgi:hypothetical protein